MPRLNLEMVGKVYLEFKANCDAEGRSMSDVVRQLVVGYNSAKQFEKYRKRLTERGRIMVRKR